MKITFNSKDYAAASITPDAVTYTGPNHNLVGKDTVALRRVLPKPVKDFAGVLRPNLKFVRTVTTNAEQGIKGDAIVDVSGSLPVGMTQSDIDALVADIASAMEAVFARDLFRQGQILSATA